MRLPKTIFTACALIVLAAASPSLAVNASSLVPPPDELTSPVQPEPEMPTSEIISKTKIQYGTNAYEIVPHSDPGKVCFLIVNSTGRSPAVTMSCWDRKASPPAN